MMQNRSVKVSHLEGLFAGGGTHLNNIIESPLRIWPPIVLSNFR